MKKMIFLASNFLLLSVPMIASALTTGPLRGTEGLIRKAGSLVTTATVIVAALALLVFFFGLVKFLMKAGDEKAVAEGKRLMIWGTIALFVMVSIWGLVRFIGSELNIDDNKDISIPGYSNSIR